MSKNNLSGSTPASRSTDISASIWLTPQEAAEYLRVDLCFIRRLANERRIPITKVGRYVRINRNELDAWLVANTRPKIAGRSR